MKKNTTKNRVLRAIVFIAIAAAAVAAVMFLWNYLVPAITGWAAINYWQALGLMVLGRLVTGGFRKPKSNKRSSRNEDGHFHPQHAHHHFEGMSKEEKREHIKRFMSMKKEAN